jgi:hypothetical protein
MGVVNKQFCGNRASVSLEVWRQAGFCVCRGSLWDRGFVAQSSLGNQILMMSRFLSFRAKSNKASTNLVQQPRIRCKCRSFCSVAGEVGHLAEPDWFGYDTVTDHMPCGIQSSATLVSLFPKPGGQVGIYSLIGGFTFCLDGHLSKTSDRYPL